MRATVIHAPRDIRLEEVPDPSIRRTGDAVVRVVASCVCGSDLWSYRGVKPVPEPRRIGHEFVGIVEAVGEDVGTVRPGDFVISPFTVSDNTCPHCRAGVHSACTSLTYYGSPDRDGEFVDACQGEYVRVPLADGTLVATPQRPTDEQIPSLLALADVLPTGWHAATSARVTAGCFVVVVGDGAVGLCGVLAATRLGAGRVVVISRHADRQALAKEFGATDIVEQRGEEGVQAIHELTNGIGADAVLECVGTQESMWQAVHSARPGATVGFVGVPHGESVPVEPLFRRNIALAGGMAPARAYLPMLQDELLAGRMDPGPIFDLTLPLANVSDGYAVMDERRAIKVLLRP